MWAVADPVLDGLREPLAGYRPPLAPDPWEMLVTLITAQQVSLHSAFAVRSRLTERFGVPHDRAWAFPTRERIAQATESGDYHRIVLGIVVMSVLVTIINRAFWRPLYWYAERKFRLS